MSKKYKVVMIYPTGDRVEEDELYDTYEEANYIGMDNCAAYLQGGEDLYLSNPGDYPFDEEDEADYEIIEVESE